MDVITRVCVGGRLLFAQSINVTVAEFTSYIQDYGTTLFGFQCINVLFYRHTTLEISQQEQLKYASSLNRLLSHSNKQTNNKTNEHMQLLVFSPLPRASVS